jgi:hypothetical protein
MEMQTLHAGKLRAIGYDSRERRLRVELEGGHALEYEGVSVDVWRRLSTVSSSTAWSYYRDYIEEEFQGKRAATRASKAANTKALDDLFKSASD